MKGLIFIYALTAIGVCGGVFRPVIGLLVYILFATLRPHFMWGFAGDMGGISQWVAIATMAGWAMRGFGDRDIRRTWVAVTALCLFSLWTFLSALQAVNTFVAWAWAVEFLKILLPFVMGLTLIRDRKTAHMALWVIVLAHAYIAFEMNRAYYVDGVNRVGLYGYGGMDNNSFGISLLSALGPALALGMVAPRVWLRGAAFASAVLILHAIILTYSRGAMIGLIVVATVAFIVLPKRPGFFVALIAGLLLAVRLAGPEVIARFQTTFAEQEERDTSAQSRVELWGACYNIASQNPVFGIGPRNFPVVAVQYGFTPGKEAHSVWMQTMAEMGFPGVTFLFSFFTITAFQMWRVARLKWTAERRTDIVIAAGIVMGIVGFVVSGQFVSMVGLETPYYVAMVGMVLLKLEPARGTEPTLSPSAEPSSDTVRSLRDWAPPSKPAVGAHAPSAFSASRASMARNSR